MIYKYYSNFYNIDPNYRVKFNTGKLFMNGFTVSSILHSRRGFALNDQSQTRENDEILAQRPERLEHEFASASGNRCSSHDTPPNVTELEITSQSANQEHQGN